MDDRYSEWHDWAGAAWALVVWAAHFSALWGASSVWPGQPAARWAALAVTAVALGALAWLWRARRIRTPRSIAGLAVAFSGISIVLGAVPAAVG